MGRALVVGVSIAFLVLARADVARAEPAANASAPPVERWSADPQWMQGQVTVNAPPASVMGLLAHVDAWPTFLTDIQSLDVKEHGPPSHWKVELETRTLDHGFLPYTIDFEPRRVRVRASGPGVSVAASTLVRDGPTPYTSNVVYALYIHLSGIPRLLISDSSLRQKQQHMVETTLLDLERAFAR